MSEPIRRGDADDSAFLAWAILAASRSPRPRGPFDDMAADADDVLDVVEWLTVSEVPSSCHHSNFLVAERDGTPVATLAGFDPALPGMAQLGGALADAFVGLGLGEPALRHALKAMEPYRSCAPELVPGTWTVEWVATRPEARRSGLCSALLDAILAEGRRRGLVRAQISIRIGNEPARAAYQKLGFVAAEERRHPDFERAYGCPGMLRMLRDL